MVSRRLAILSVAAGGLMLAACAPIPAVMDTPKSGDRVALSVEQPLQVRWSNANPKAGEWVVQREPGASAVALVKHTAQPPEGGAMGLDTFEFVGAKPGSETLTFAYQRKDGQPGDANDRISIKVTVG